jgi:hypothetical protein
MKKILNQILVCLFALVLCQEATAQRNYAFYSFQNLSQSHYYNPAFRGTNKFFISLPIAMQSLGATNSGFNVNDLFSVRQDDSVYFDATKALSRMNPLNYFDVHMQNEIIGFAFGTKKFYMSFSATHRTNFQLAYPRDLIQLVVEGNGGGLLGKRASLDGLGVNLNSYIEYAYGFNRKFGEKLVVGGRVKFLSGMANVSTRKSKLGLTTNEENYALTLDGALDLRSSGIYPIVFEDADPMSLLKNALSFKNFGTAMDIGVTYKLTENLKISTSVLDAGFISWKEDVHNFKKEDVDYTFDGVDMNQALRDSAYFDKFLDTLKEIYRIEENTEAYTAALPVRIIVGANYKLNKVMNVGTYLFNDFSNKKYRPTAIVSTTFKLGKLFQVNTNYMATTNSFANLGLGACLKGAGMQFYVSSDNILGVFNPYALKNVHVSAGFNFCIGRVKDSDKLAEVIE